MIEIDFRDIPLYMKAGARGVEAAGIQMLNTVAFKSLPDLVSEAQSGMKFRQNARGALGWQVEKATASRPYVHIQTRRKWLRPHLVDGRRESTAQGWQWNGREYIVVPIKKAAFGRGGTIKAGYLANFYIIPKGDKGLVFYRAKRGAKQSELIAVLVPSAPTHEDTKPEQVINHRFNADATKLLRKYLQNARFKANAGGIF